MAASRSVTAMATWSISVSRPVMGANCCRRRPTRTSPPAASSRSGAVAAERGDAVLTHPGPQLGVADAQPVGRGQAAHADLALVEVVVDLVGRLAHLVQGVGGGEDGLDLAQADEAVGLPRLLVVGEVRRLDRLQLHPQVAV